MNLTQEMQKMQKKKENRTDQDVLLIRPILDIYKKKPGSLITILQKTQEILGYLPLNILQFISEETGIKSPIIYGVATFYAQFRLAPVGENLILLCKGTACHVNGATSIQEAICDELQIEDGQTTKDGFFTLNTVACLGCCSLSPVMMINGETYAKLTPKKARGILRDIRKRNLLASEKEEAS